MTHNETITAHRLMVQRLEKSGEAILATLTPEKVALWHMATGLALEGAEVLEIIKRHVIYGEPLNIDGPEGMRIELGDGEFYAESLRMKAGLSRIEILAANMDKLLTGKRARYAEGVYSDAQAMCRQDKQEPFGTDPKDVTVGT